MKASNGFFMPDSIEFTVSPESSSQLLVHPLLRSVQVESPSRVCFDTTIVINPQGIKHESLEPLIELSSKYFEDDTPIKISQQSSSNITLPSTAATTFRTTLSSHVSSNFSRPPNPPNPHNFFTIL